MAGPDEQGELSTAARKALSVAIGILAVCLVVQIFDSVDHYRLLTAFGLRPRDVASLPDIVLSCFVHFSWTHFGGNSVPLVVFGFLAAYQGIGKFVLVTAIVMVTSNLYWWTFGPQGSYAAGASGMIWGWIAYGFVRGAFHRDELNRFAIVIISLLYGTIALDLVFPGPVDWQAHIGGLVGGLLCGLALRDRPASLTVSSKPVVMPTA